MQAMACVEVCTQVRHLRAPLTISDWYRCRASGEPSFVQNDVELALQRRGVRAVGRVVREVTFQRRIRPVGMHPGLEVAYPVNPRCAVGRIVARRVELRHPRASKWLTSPVTTTLSAPITAIVELDVIHVQHFKAVSVE